MTPIALLEWRRKYGVSQDRLALLLGKSRGTVINWERGHTRMPKAFEDQLQALVPHLATGTRREDTGPETVNSKTASHLYIWRKGIMEPKELHPESLFPGRWEPGKVPYSFLGEDEYLEAVERWETAYAEDQAEQHRIGLQRALEGYQNDPTQPHAPTCKCLVCAVLRREGYL